MTVDEQLIWELEREFWTGEEKFYEQNLWHDARVLFPEQVGLLDRKATIDSLSEGPRWSHVELRDRNEVRLGAGMTLIAYKALASREGEHETYAAHGVSIYQREDMNWMLAFHYQVPAAG